MFPAPALPPLSVFLHDLNSAVVFCVLCIYIQGRLRFRTFMTRCRISLVGFEK